MINENSTPEEILAVLNSCSNVVLPDSADTILISREKISRIRKIFQSDVLSSYAGETGVNIEAATSSYVGLLIVLDFAHSLTVEALEKGCISEEEAKSIFDALNPLLEGYDFD